MIYWIKMFVKNTAKQLLSPWNVAKDMNSRWLHTEVWVIDFKVGEIFLEVYGAE